MLLKSLYITFLALFAFYSDGQESRSFRDGDLIFIVNPGGQGKAIQLATGSEFTHVGIVFVEDGKPVVYHAVEPVSRNTVAEFISMSTDGNYQIKRLKDAKPLSPEMISKMRSDAAGSLGKHYDYGFNWNDNELYCSEFVWKLYFNNLKLMLGTPKALKEFSLDHPLVKTTLQQRYGQKIPLDEKMISPGDVYKSDLLK